MKIGEEGKKPKFRTKKQTNKIPPPSFSFYLQREITYNTNKQGIIKSTLKCEMVGVDLRRSTLLLIFLHPIAFSLAAAKCKPDPIFKKFLEIRKSQIENTDLDKLSNFNATVKNTIIDLKRTDEIWASITEVISRF